MLISLEESAEDMDDISERDDILVCFCIPNIDVGGNPRTLNGTLDLSLTHWLALCLFCTAGSLLLLLLLEWTKMSLATNNTQLNGGHTLD